MAALWTKGQIQKKKNRKSFYWRLDDSIISFLRIQLYLMYAWILFLAKHPPLNHTSFPPIWTAIQSSKEDVDATISPSTNSSANGDFNPPPRQNEDPFPQYSWISLQWRCNETIFSIVNISWFWWKTTRENAFVLSSELSRATDFYSELICLYNLCDTQLNLSFSYSKPS